MKARLMALAGLILCCSLGAGCTGGGEFDRSLNSIVQPFRFSIAGWEAAAISQDFSQWFSGSQAGVGGSISVVAYFALAEQIKTLPSALEAGDAGELELEIQRLGERRTALAATVEGVVERQIKGVLAQQGIYNPVDEYIGWRVTFPPVNFRLEKPPHLLVVSPRDRIESLREVMLRPELSLEEMEDIEAEVDKLGVSSLVVGLGGLGATYPCFVTSEATLQFVIDAATEEWLHQYLVFKPLGFRYLMDLTGVRPDYEIATMNETLASMVSQEIGTMVYQQHYARYEAILPPLPPADPDSEFNREMREIRRTVDQYLERGEIVLAEDYMEQKRQELAAQGYYIRKLNQAYFAFYGAYADSPTSVSPIGLEMRELRDRSASLKEFLNTAAAMGGRADLQASLK